MMTIDNRLWCPHTYQGFVHMERTCGRRYGALLFSDTSTLSKLLRKSVQRHSTLYANRSEVPRLLNNCLSHEKISSSSCEKTPCTSNNTPLNGLEIVYVSMYSYRLFLYAVFRFLVVQCEWTFRLCRRWYRINTHVIRVKMYNSKTSELIGPSLT